MNKNTTPILQKGALVLAVFSLLLVATNSMTTFSNRELSRQVNDRAAQLQNGPVFANVYQNLVQGLANLATARRDDAIKGLLAANNIALENQTANSQPATAPRR